MTSPCKGKEPSEPRGGRNGKARCLRERCSRAVWGFQWLLCKEKHIRLKKIHVYHVSVTGVTMYNIYIFKYIGTHYISRENEILLKIEGRNISCFTGGRAQRFSKFLFLVSIPLLGPRVLEIFENEQHKNFTNSVNRRGRIECPPN